MYLPTVHSSPPSFHSDLPPNYPHHSHLNDISRDAQSSTLPALPILPSISPPTTIAEYDPNEEVAHKYAQHLSGALTTFRAELEPSYTLPFYNPSPSDVPGVTPIVTYPPSTAPVTGVLVSPHGAGLSSGTLSTFPQQSKGANAQNPARTGYATPDGYRCPLYSCGRLYKHIGHLKRHLRTHTMEKPYLCPKCSEGFSRSDNLNVHLQTHEISGFPSGTAMGNNVGVGGMDGGGMGIDIGAVVPGGQPAHKGSFESELAHRRRDESAPVPRERPYPSPRLGIRGVQRPGRAPPSQYSSTAEHFGLGSPEARERVGLGAATFVHRQAHEELILPSQQQSSDLNAQDMQ